MSVLNFHLVIKQELSLKNVLESMHKHLDLHIEVDHLCSIKNWQWEDEQRLNCQKEIANSLSQGRIVVVYFDKKEFENFGVYIENIDAMYIYSFWWNANETEICNMKGKELLQHLSATSMLDRLERIISECCTDFVSIAFGEETAFNYCKCTQKMVETSHNIVFWLFKKCDAIKSISSLQKIGDIAYLNASLYMPCQTCV